MPNRTITAKAIRQARQRAGESQTQFAERFGVDQSTISLWETVAPPERGPARKLLELVLAELAELPEVSRRAEAR